MNNSTLTLQDVKEHFIRSRGITNITDEDVIDAANDFYTLVHQVERRVDPGKYRVISAQINITSSGYDLSGLTNIANYKEGFRVYKDAVKTGNTLLRMHPASQKDGYYLEGNTLYLTPNKASDEIFIEYRTKGARVALGTTLSDHTLQINQDLETAFREYVRKSFYDGSYEFDLESQAVQKALAEIENYFKVNTSVVSI